ncbi:glycosyltransferase [Streptacidiphilus monticola]
MLAHTVRRLLLQDHPDFEVLIVVGHDDPGTTRVAEMLADEDPRVRVVVDHSVPKNKPKGLNTALPQCRGEIVGVFDAEDEVAPALLRHVDTLFRAEQAHVVQGGVQLMNLRSSWWSLRNCLEYFFWFSSRLHYHARNGFVPLGGNTVFLRADLLRAAGGWDAECLAEDCELGIRLSTAGARVAVAYSPELATREETPPTLRGLVKQRTRWNQGYLQVLKRGSWRALPTAGRRLMARYLLAMPYLQALSGILVPVSLVAVLLLRAPVPYVLMTFTPLAPTLTGLVVEVLGLHEFGRMYGIEVRLRDYAKLVLGAVPYQLLLSFAALRAAVREVRGARLGEDRARRSPPRPQEAKAAASVPVAVRSSAE